MRLSNFRVPATIMGLALLSSMSAAPANAAVATVDCGIVTCSLYLTRNTTKEICERLCQYSNTSNAVIAGAAAAACAATGVGTIASGACAAAGAVWGGFFIDKLQQATNANQCLRIRYLKPTPPVNAPVPTGLYVDRSGFCKN